MYCTIRMLVSERTIHTTMTYGCSAISLCTRYILPSICKHSYFLLTLSGGMHFVCGNPCFFAAGMTVVASQFALLERRSPIFDCARKQRHVGPLLFGAHCGICTTTRVGSSEDPRMPTTGSDVTHAGS